MVCILVLILPGMDIECRAIGPYSSCYPSYWGMEISRLIDFLVRPKLILVKFI